MTDIELINVDGVIKGVDPETGDEVPIQFDNLNTTSIDTVSINNTVEVDTAQGYANAVSEGGNHVVVKSEIDVSSLTPIAVARETKVSSRQYYKDKIVNNSSNNTHEIDQDAYSIEFEGVRFSGDHSAPHHFGNANDNIHEVNFRYCRFGGYSDAAYVSSGEWRVSFSNCDIGGNNTATYGIKSVKNPGVNQISIINETSIYNHRSDGVQINSVGSFSFTDSTSEQNGGWGINIPDSANVQGFSVLNPHIEGNSSGGVYIGSTGSGTGAVVAGKFFENGSGPELSIGPNATVFATAQSMYGTGGTSVKTDANSSGHTLRGIRQDSLSADLNHTGGSVRDCDFSHTPSDCVFSDVSGSRSLGTWYQNTFNKPIKVAVQVENDGDRIDTTLDINSSQSGNGVEKYINTNSPNIHRYTHSGVVPPSHYYRVVGGSGGESIQFWKERIKY